MLKVPISPPAPALKALLDELIVPALVARFLRERAAATARWEVEDDAAVSRTKVIETGRTGSSPG